MSGTVEIGGHVYRKPVHRCSRCGELDPLILCAGGTCPGCFEAPCFEDLEEVSQ